MSETSRVYFQKLARVVGFRSALRAMRKLQYTSRQCRDTLFPVRHCVRVQ